MGLGSPDKPDPPPKPDPKPTVEPKSTEERAKPTTKRRRVKQSGETGLLSTMMGAEYNQEEQKHLLGE